MSKWQDTVIGRLPSEWEINTLVDVASTGKKSIISGPFGSNIGRKYFVDEGIPVIRGNNLTLDIGTKFVDDGFVFLTPEKADSLGTWASVDDLVFTAAGTIGQVGIITDDLNYPRYIISNKQLRATLDKDKIDPYFAYYWFASNYMQRWIINWDTGSTIPLINLSVIKSLPVPFPPLSEQKAIAKVLSSLDDKIDLLKRQNQTLEALAQTLFREWFVEKAHDEWEEGVIGDYCDVVDCLHAKKPDEIEGSEDSKFLLQVYNIADGGIIDLSKKYYVSDDDYDEWIRRIELTKGDLIISKTGRVGAIAQIPKMKTGIGRNLVAIRAKENFSPEYLKDLMLSNWMKRKIHLNTSDGTILRSLHVKSISALPAFHPTKYLIDKYSDMVRPVHRKIWANVKQSEILEKLRDTLLPKLMSGEVRVRH